MRGAALCALLALSGCCGRFGEGWDTTNTVMEVAFAAEVAVDMAQTRTIVANCQEYNPIVGVCGQRMPYFVYDPLTVVIHLVAAFALRQRARTIMEAGTLGVEGHVIYLNAITPDVNRRPELGGMQ